MKLPIWVIYVGVFGALCGGAVAQALKWRAETKKKIADVTIEYRRLERQQNDYNEEDRAQAEVNQRRDKMRDYEKTWTDRIKTYETREALNDLLVTQTSAMQMTLATGEGDDTQSKVIPIVTGFYRIEWQAAGSVANSLKWLANIEERIDFLRVVDTTWEVRDDGTVDVSVSAQVQLPQGGAR